MEHALKEASIALEHGEFPVGCVLVDGETIVSRGHRQNSEGESGNELDHAEIVTLRSFLDRQPQTDCSAITAYSTMEPCLMCFSTLLLSGIRRFVWAYEDVMGGGTALPLDRVAPLYAAMKIELVPAVMRQQSLALFYQFFDRYSYWQNSLLERYTREQFEKMT